MTRSEKLAAARLKRRNRRYYLAHREKWATVYADNKRRKHERPKRRPWTTREDAIMRSLYAEEHNSTLEAFLRRSACSIYGRATTLGLKKSPDYLAELLSTLGSKLAASDKGHRFPKGHVPQNKGKKGHCPAGCEKGWFKKGKKPANTWLPVGAERVNKDGILQRKVTDNGGYNNKDWKSVHSLVWIEHNGPIPPGHIVVFRDRNRRNFDPANLELISYAENMRRNTVHNLPKELARVVQLRGALIRQLNKRESRETN